MLKKVKDISPGLTMCEVDVDSKSSMIPFHQDWTHAMYILVTWGFIIHPIIHMGEGKSKGKEKGRKRRDWGIGWELASELRHPWETGEMASPPPKFPQVLSKLLSRTLVYSSLDGNLEVLHSKFLLWQKAKLPPSSGKCTIPVWGLLLSKMPEDKVTDELLLGSQAPQWPSW